jgi:hypothetical protein
VTLRIIWAALLMGLLSFAVVVLMMGHEPTVDASMRQLLFYIAIGMAVVLIPAGFVVRRVMYRKGRQDDGSVSPQMYSTGNILFFAFCEGVGMFAITCMMINGGGPGPHAIIAAVAAAVLLLNFPKRAPLEPDGSIKPIHGHD